MCRHEKRKSKRKRNEIRKDKRKMIKEVLRNKETKWKFI